MYTINVYKNKHKNWMGTVKHTIHGKFTGGLLEQDEFTCRQTPFLQEILNQIESYIVAKEINKAE